MKIRVGNRHKIVEPKDAKKRNIHSWTCFAELVDDKQMEKCAAFISKVRFELHETFKNPVRETKAKNGCHFELSSVGWGYFDIPITIFWTEETGLKPLSVNHELCFDGKGEWKEYSFDISEKYMS